MFFCFFAYLMRYRTLHARATPLLISIQCTHAQNGNMSVSSVGKQLGWEKCVASLRTNRLCPCHATVYRILRHSMQFRLPGRRYIIYPQRSYICMASRLRLQDIDHPTGRTNDRLGTRQQDIRTRREDSHDSHRRGLLRNTINHHPHKK